MTQTVRDILILLASMTVRDAIQLRDELGITDKQIMDMSHAATGLVHYMTVCEDPTVPAGARRKIQAIKAVREQFLGMALKEAKEFVEGGVLHFEVPTDADRLEGDLDGTGYYFHSFYSDEDQVG